MHLPQFVRVEQFTEQLQARPQPFCTGVNIVQRLGVAVGLDRARGGEDGERLFEQKTFDPVLGAEGAIERGGRRCAHTPAATGFVIGDDNRASLQ